MAQRLKHRRRRQLVSSVRRGALALWKRLDWADRGIALLIFALIGGLLLFRWQYQPRLPDGDVCQIFEQRPAWFSETLKVEERWSVSPALQMAILRHESGYRSRARPPRRKILGILPGPRASSAFGYCQAINSTWSDYQADRRKPSARRDSFEDAVDFVGWYHHRIRGVLGQVVDDPYHLYLAYNQGPKGYRSALMARGAAHRYAQRVASTALAYEKQLASCRDRLARRLRWQWFLEASTIAVLVALLVLGARRRRHGMRRSSKSRRPRSRQRAGRGRQ